MVYSEKSLFWHYYLQLPFVYKTVSQISLNCFVREMKGFYRSSLGNEFDFRDIMNVSQDILAKNQNFKKLRQSFVDERALITTTLLSSCHWKTLVPFYLRKKTRKRIFNINSELLQNLCHPKQW